jgi:D-sedoheptulose 7-phosphate isomerase
VAVAAGAVESRITRIFKESVAAKLRFVEEHRSTLVHVIELIAAAIRSGKKLLLFGNGGSAADAQHIAAEFTNRMVIERPPLPAIALTTDTSALTSIANDYGYDEVFAKQIAALGQAGDVAIAISTSGNSPNVLAALRVCRDKKIRTVGLTGRDGGQMARQVDYLLNVSATTETSRIQETHIVAGHTICELVDERLFGKGDGVAAAEQPSVSKRRATTSRSAPPTTRGRKSPRKRPTKRARGRR